jgi:hypothetical protein
MICFAEPVLTENLYVVRKKEFLITRHICAIHVHDKRPSIFIRDKHVFSSERMLHKDYERKGSVAKKKKSLAVNLKGLDAKTN